MAISALLVFIFLCFGIPFGLVYGLKHVDIDIIDGLPFLIIAYSSVRLSYVTYVGTPRFLNVTFWTFVYCFFGVVPLLQFLTGDYSMQGSYGRHQLAFAMGIVICGIGAFDFGQFLAWKRIGFNRARRLVKHTVEREIVINRLVLLFGLAISTLGVAMSVIGPLEYLFSSRAEVFEYFAALPGPGQVSLNLASSAVRVPILIVSLACCSLMLNNSDIRSLGGTYLRPFITLGAWSAVIAGLLANNPINSPRYLVGSIGLAIVCIYATSRWRRRYMSWLIVLLAMSLLIVFPMLDLFRYSTTDRLVYSLDFTGITENLTTKGDFDAFQQLANVVAYVDANGAALGRQLLGAVLFFAPRALWPDKPQSTGMTVGEWMNYDFTNVSCPLWGEFYVDMGLGGVFIGFIAYGWFIGTMERRLAEMRSTPLKAFGDIVLGILAPYQIFFLRGSLLPAIAYLSPILLGLWIISRRSTYDRSREAGAPLAGGNAGGLYEGRDIVHES